MFVEITHRWFVRMVFCACISTASGCAIVGDGVVLVEGNLLTPSGAPIENCEIELLVTNYDGSYGKRHISGEFRVSFIIGGNKLDHYFIIECEEFETTHETKSFRFGGNTHDMQPLDIGQIVFGN